MSDYSDTHWMKDSPEKPADIFQGLIPELWAVDKMVLRNCLDALQSSLEYARECLATHDSTLGRTTKKNKSWAETIESDIRLIEKSIKELKLVEVNHSTHYP